MITIDTPHYGSSLARKGVNQSSWLIGNYLGWGIAKMCPMDWDLADDSRLFTGNSYKIHYLTNALAGVNFKCKKYAYLHQSPKLQGNEGISTQYYAIGGVDYGEFICKEPVAVEFVRFTNSSNQFLGSLVSQADINYNIDLIGIRKDSNDNIIDIMTQFGMKLDENDIVEFIRLDYTTLIVYGWDNFKYSILSLWHNDIRNEKITQNVILKYLKVR